MRFTILSIILFVITCCDVKAEPLSLKALTILANKEVILLGGDPNQMTVYIDLFSFDRDIAGKQDVWEKIKTKLDKSELWEIHYFPTARVFDGEFLVLIDKKTGKVFATFDMVHGTILK